VSFLEGIPREMEESAFMDGASVYRTFLQIIVPLIAPAVGTIVILNFLGVWNEFLFAFIFVDKESLRTIPVGLQSLNGRYFTNWGPIGAGMVVATMPTLLIYLIFSRQIQKGMVVGAVKG
jgi:raffinose/stachyose/melibiose transport system permease protein